MKQTLQNLLAEGKTKQAIAQLRQITTYDTDLQAEVVQLSARFTEYERQKRMDIEDPSVLRIELAKINNALLSVIDRLDKSVERSGNLQGFPNVNPLPNPSPQGFSWTKWTGLNDVKSWIAVLAGLAGIMTFYFKFCKNVPDNDGKPFSVVVYTHGQGGRQDIINLKDTKLVADFGGRREDPIVGKNGQNTFNEVPAKFRNTRIGIGLEGNEGYILQHDSNYVLNGEPIYLAIQSSCRFCTIAGTVRNQKQFIKNAIVSTANFSDTTDVNGYFEIHVPPLMEKSEYGVTVRLNNKIVWDKFITPNPKQPTEILIQ